MMIESTIDSDVMNVDDNVHIEYQNERRVYHMLCIHRGPLALPRKHHEEAGLICFPKNENGKTTTNKAKTI